MSSFDPGNRLVVALDVATAGDADAFVAQLDGAPSWVKVGLELFCAAGPALVRGYVERGLRVMLDLKLHDIPQTVARSTAAVAGLGAGLLTVHAAGGAEMLRAAVAAVAGTDTRVLAVTVLTSMDDADLAATGQATPGRDLVLARARLAHASGCHGVVASPLEAAALRAALPRDFLIVTPGIRPAAPGEVAAAVGDQKRVASPAEAMRAGADLVVVGRPIRDAADPAAAARAVIAELAHVAAAARP
jgi:orotidine-5'-phosphate decarboxylase